MPTDFEAQWENDAHLRVQITRTPHGFFLQMTVVDYRALRRQPYTWRQEWYRLLLCGHSKARYTERMLNDVSHCLEIDVYHEDEAY